MVGAGAGAGVDEEGGCFSGEHYVARGGAAFALTALNTTAMPLGAHVLNAISISSGCTAFLPYGRYAGIGALSGVFCSVMLLLGFGLADKIEDKLKKLPFLHFPLVVACALLPSASLALAALAIEKTSDGVAWGVAAGHAGFLVIALPLAVVASGSSLAVWARKKCCGVARPSANQAAQAASGSMAYENIL